MNLFKRDWDVIEQRAERIKDFCDDQNLTSSEAQNAAYADTGPYMSAVNSTPAVGNQ